MFLLFVSFILILLLIAGCNKKSDEKLVIATIIPDFNDTIKNIYQKNFDYPIEIKSILSNAEEISNHWNDLDKVINQFLEENTDVDIIYGFPPEYLSGLIDGGNLENLNNVVDKNIFKNITPAILDPIKKAGEGEIYAVAPTFNDQVLVINEKIFETLKIDEPKTEITWDEIYELANEIQKNSQYKGISLGFPSSDEQYYQLYVILSKPIENFRNVKGRTIVNTETYNKYWTLFQNIYNNNSKVTNEEFIKGNVAMAVFPLAQLTDTDFLEFYDNLDKTNWKIMKLPVFKENAGSLGYSDALFSITKFGNKQLSGEFIEHVQGKELATSFAEASIFPSYWDEDIIKIFQEKYNLDFTSAFTQSGALINKPNFPGEKFNNAINSGEKYFVESLQEKTSVEDALRYYEEELNK